MVKSQKHEKFSGVPFGNDHRSTRASIEQLGNLVDGLQLSIKKGIQELPGLRLSAIEGPKLGEGDAHLAVTIVDDADGLSEADIAQVRSIFTYAAGDRMSITITLIDPKTLCGEFRIKK